MLSQLTHILRQLAPEAPRRLSAMKAAGDRKYVELTTDKVWTPLDTPAIAELAQLDQWVVSKYVERNGKLDKPPFSPNSKRQCSHSNPSHWSSYDTARAALPGFAWLGFVFHESDPYSGIDLDGCRDPQTGVIEAWAQRIIDLAQSYTEISPSGAGVKIFVRGTLADTLLHSLGAHKGIEVYSMKRYFTVTGQHLAGTPTEIRDAQSALDQLQQELKPPTVEPPKVERAIGVINITPRASAGRASLDDVKARFNAEHTLDSLLTGYGAVQTKDGYSCPFCTHTHETTLYISKHGRLFSYSPNCKLYTTKGYDAFGLYVLIEHSDNALAAAKTLNPIMPRQKRQQPPLVEPAPARVQTSEQAQDAQRKRDARKAAAAATVADVQARASQDEALSDNAQLVLLALLDYAGSRDWCRPSVARLADMLQISRRSVFYGLHDLENTYVKSEPQRGGTTRRTFIRVQAQTAENRVFAPEFIYNLDLIPTLGASERAPLAQPAAEPAEWEFWQAAEWECSGYDLALESEPEPEPASVPSEPPADTAPIAVLQAAPIWRVASDKRGMWFLRGPAGECIVFGRDEGAARLALAAMTPAPLPQDFLISPVLNTEPPRQEAKTATVAVLEPEPDADGGAAYIPELDQIEPLHAPKRSRAKKSPIEAAAVAKSRRQARWRAMDAPELRKNLIVLSRKADKTPNPAQRYALKEQCAEIQHYLAIKDARIDAAAVVARGSQAPARRAAVAQQGAFL